jgi:VWFA-related protein
VVKANTRLVVVDVVATDSKGAPVTDLAAQDLTVLENGRPQKISEFSFQHPQAIASSEPHLPPNVFTNVPVSKTSSLNVILLDALNGEFASRAHALDELNKYLESGPVIQPTAVYLLEHKLKLMHDFTTDTKVLKDVLAGFHPQVAAPVDTVYASASPFTQKGTLQANAQTIEITLKALNALALSLAGYPGRKNLIWLSEAFPVNLFPDEMKTADVLRAKPGGTSPPAGSNETATMQMQFGKNSSADYIAEVEKVADAFMTAQVAVYPIDAAGVGRISQLESLTTMRSMAERTGGKTYANQNDLTAGLRNSMDDGSTYYTLTYYPEDKTWDGKFRHIDVKSGRSGVNLRYRLGYYALNPGLEAREKEDSKKLGEEFSQALALDSPSSTAILFHATVTPPVAGGQKVTVNFAIDPHTLAYTEKDGAQQASLGCAIMAYSGKGSMVRNEINNVMGKVKSEEFSKLMQSNFPCQSTIELKPGQYTLRLGVVDKTSKVMGTTTASVTVP